MARRVIDLRSGGRALLDVASYGRSAGRPLTSIQRRQITLTVGRTPEVMVKVSGGARSLGGVETHLAYMGREGELGVETDFGLQLVGKNFQKQIVPDWDLDLMAHRIQDARSIRGIRRPGKLISSQHYLLNTPGDTPWEGTEGGSEAGRQ